MVKEFRALSRAEAVEAMYQDMAARHRARFRSVQILRVAEIEKKEDVRRPYIKQLLEPGLKFPLPHRRTKSKAWYAANKPVCPLVIIRMGHRADMCRRLGLSLAWRELRCILRDISIWDEPLHDSIVGYTSTTTSGPVINRHFQKHEHDTSVSSLPQPINPILGR